MVEGFDMKKHLTQMHFDNLHLELTQLRNAQAEWKRIEKIDLSDKNAVPFHMHIGMRTAKTILAVFLCGLIGWVIGQPPLFSMFAAIICVQNKTDDTVKSAYNRMLGTIVGGSFAVATVYISWIFEIPSNSLFYYTSISFLLLPVIFTTLYIRKPTTTALSCIVFVAITLSEFDTLNPLLSALWRTFDTMIGIAVILFLELIFPYHPKISPKTEEMTPVTQEQEEKNLDSSLSEKMDTKEEKSGVEKIET